MESRFSHLRSRDTSVSMLRVKLSRRRSQVQKENRDRAVNTRRQLEQLQEMDVSSLDASIAAANASVVRGKTQLNAKSTKNTALEERLKQLERWKERKVLEKEKEKRERERKGVFKTGLYHHKDNGPITALPVVAAAPKRTRETKVTTAASQTSRVTRSMKQQQQHQPLKTQDPNALAKKAEPVGRAVPTRAARKPPVTALPVVKDKPKDKAPAVRTMRSRAVVSSVVPPAGKEKHCKAPKNQMELPPETKEPELKKAEEKPDPPSAEEEEEQKEEEEPMVVEPESAASSFAPQGFVFQAPVGLSSFKFQPLTPRTADAFLTPTSSFSLPPVPLFDDESNEPSPRTPQTVAPPLPGSPEESKHDVPYFRKEITDETERLTTLCTDWESKVEDESIPEEMRDRMRTAVGQARLLMKERFKQFGGLVDDCELGRGEKITTCTDLQGFWDMVYFQVEDVKKKFEALREAEGRGWVEEHKPPPRQRKVVKKPSGAAAPKPAGTKAAAKSRLAAAKAAMKARQQAAEAEDAAKDAGNGEEVAGAKSQDAEEKPDTAVFNGGFSEAASPAKAADSLRRSSRLSSAAALPPASPSSNCLTPRRSSRRSLASAHTPALGLPPPAHSGLTPAALRLTLGEAAATPRATPQRGDAVSSALCFSPVRETTSEETQDNPESVLGTVPSVCVEEQQQQEEEPAAAVDDDDDDVPPRVSPCRTSPPPPQPSSSLSFSLSPCDRPSASVDHTEAPGSSCCSPSSSAVEEVSGLDFERYLQPSHRCSLSPPRETVAMETMSPMDVDVEESPEDLLSQEEEAAAAVSAAAAAVSSVFCSHSPQVRTADAALLLFTPELKDRIRQSVCPRDLMVFTPPS